MTEKYQPHYLAFTVEVIALIILIYSAILLIKWYIGV